MGSCRVASIVAICSAILAGCMAAQPIYLKERPDFAVDRDWLKRSRNVDEATNCVSLSGGGMRSATFSLGILRGLYDSMRTALGTYSNRPCN